MSNDNPLFALAAIISSGVHTLNDAYSQRGHSFPSLTEPFRPGPLDDDKDVADATHLIVAAAHQIIATVRKPMDTFLDYAPAMYMSRTLGFADEMNIADLLKDKPEGMHVDDIGAKIDVDSVTLARILRYLATRHVFREVAPNVFANNRLSSFMEKVHPIEEIKPKSLTLYDGAPAAAFVGHATDETFKSLDNFSSFVRDRKAKDPPFKLTFKTQKTLWQWYEEPDNQWRGRRFAAAMKGFGDHIPSSAYIEGFDWQSLKPDSVVVDVGGSLGTAMLVLVNAFPHLKFVVQDLEPVIVDARKFWDEKAPELVSSGQVSFQGAGNFFEPQVSKQTDVYFLRLVLHDWPDSANEKILNNLRAVAAPHTKIVIFDTIMPLACPDEAGPPPPPFPLLANLGLAVGGFLTMLDLQMLTSFNGQERTFTQFVELGARTGWKFEGVKPGMLSAFVFSTA
ncbi:S-adenosyl-L-methionine-dependent methyltransferase [Auriscalpium vulgare]|uniref:S-adenosyl-L-methionine-dependent methyltransferase n=1 Tax=Auriscalpium vulgare TaxID=40419 RepID=A0ACB8RIX9_9AGAM|nr:S-adenosyl-L-methionine-dependent methyltransferase [Auriscalpium vulgare]